jgi:hypothetical protein
MQVKHFKTLPKSLTRDKFLPTANVYTVEDYFALPKNKREKFGLYLNPIGLPMDGFWGNERTKGWEFFSKEIRKHYPVQGYIREVFLSYDNPIYTFFAIKKMKLSDSIHVIKRFFNPFHTHFRKAYPRHINKDISCALVDVNFALILDFWHHEVVDGFISWNHDVPHRTFFKKLKDAVQYIEVKRPALQKKADLELSKYIATQRKHKNKKSVSFYKNKHSKYDKIEQQIFAKDTEILTWAIQNRKFFWT